MNIKLFLQICLPLYCTTIELLPLFTVNQYYRQPALIRTLSNGEVAVDILTIVDDELFVVRLFCLKEDVEVYLIDRQPWSLTRPFQCRRAACRRARRSSNERFLSLLSTIPDDVFRSEPSTSAAVGSSSPTSPPSWIRVRWRSPSSMRPTVSSSGSLSAAESDDKELPMRLWCSLSFLSFVVDFRGYLLVSDRRRMMLLDPVLRCARTYVDDRNRLSDNLRFDDRQRVFSFCRQIRRFLSTKWRRIFYINLYSPRG